MFNVKTMNKIAEIGTDRLDREKFAVSADFEKPEAIIVRSAKLLDMEFNPELLSIARAGAGYNNIPTDRCAESGIVVFNTPGANANGVKELVLCSLFMSSRDVAGGMKWVGGIADKGDEVAGLVEAGKSAFAGPEILGKTLGIVGLGAIGAKVARDVLALGMKVYGYDPYLPEAVRTEFAGKATFVDDVNELYAASDYVTLHLPYIPATAGTINKNTIAMMKDGVRVINLARGELVNDDDMIEALKSGKVARYVTDFPNGKTAMAENVIAFPHLGASTPESEDNCAIMAADQTAEYLLRGNIVNSVNLPNIFMERVEETNRVVIIGKDGFEAAAREALTASEIAAEKCASRGGYTVMLCDVKGCPFKAAKAVREIAGVIKARGIK